MPRSDQDLNSFAKNLRRLRKERGLTLDELGRRAGLDRMTIHRYELGHRRMPAVDILFRLAEALDVTWKDLVGAPRGSIPEAFSEHLQEFAASPWGQTVEGGPVTYADLRYLLHAINNDELMGQRVSVDQLADRSAFPSFEALARLVAALRFLGRGRGLVVQHADAGADGSILSDLEPPAAADPGKRKP